MGIFAGILECCFLQPVRSLAECALHVCRFPRSAALEARVTPKRGVAYYEYLPVVSGTNCNHSIDSVEYISAHYPASLRRFGGTIFALARVNSAHHEQPTSLDGCRLAHTIMDQCVVGASTGLLLICCTKCDMGSVGIARKVILLGNTVSSPKELKGR